MKIVAMLLLVAVLPISARTIESQSTAGEIKDPCDWLEVGMFLKRVWKQGESFWGVFEVKPWNFTNENKPIVFEGDRKKNGFHMSFPDASLYFTDANGKWHPRFEWGDVIRGPTDRLAISFRGKATIVVELPTSEWAERAEFWRVAIRDVENKTCIWSVPFKVVQQRGPVTSFKTDRLPSWMIDDTREVASCGKASTSATMGKSSTACSGASKNE